MIRYPIECYWSLEAEEAFTALLERLYPQGESADACIYVERAMTEKEVVEKIARLRDTKFNGDTQKMFDHYAHDGALSKAELTIILIDAKIGNRLTRGAIVKGIMDRIDKDEDQSISADELNAVLRG